MNSPMSNPAEVDLRKEKGVNTKQQLIEATIKVIAEKGLAGTTLTTVSKASGLARSSVGFHFKSKDQMLNETLQYLLDEYKAGWLGIYEHQDLSPAEKLTAIIDWDLGPQVCNSEKVAIWFAFWGEVSTRPIYKQLVVDSDNQYHQILQNLAMELCQDQRKANLIANGLGCMVIGLWMDLHIYDEPFDRDLAKDSCYSLLKLHLPEHFSC